jgi:hypothetical protein
MVLLETSNIYWNILTDEKLGVLSGSVAGSWRIELYRYYLWRSNRGECGIELGTYSINRFKVILPQNYHILSNLNINKTNL